LPAEIAEQISVTQNRRDTLRAELGREPTLGELAKDCNTTVQALQELLEHNRTFISLQAPINEDGGTVGDLVGNMRYHEPPDESLPVDATHRDAAGLLLRLVDAAYSNARTAQRRRRNVLALRLRLGLVDGKEWSYRAIGSHLGVSHEAVRLIVNAGLENMKALAPRLDEFRQ
jgi:DNA-directed RNA polymerase sigma subunit (sigma70/sigma32)